MRRTLATPARRTACLLAAVAVLGACGGDDDAGGAAAGGDGADHAGSVVIDGSSTVAPLSEAIAEEFRTDQPRVEVSVGTSGTGGGFETFCSGETDISDASRAIKDEEKQACAAAGVDYTELRVGLDGLAVVTSAENRFVECLSIEQLATIFSQGGATTWDQVDPGFPAEPIAVFAPGTDSGTYDFFVEKVLGDPGDPATPKPRADYTASEDDNTLVQGIKGERSSWGFFGYAYFSENRSVLKGIRVSGDKGECVAPSNETVESGDYPLSRPLFIYVKNSALARPEVKEFVRFYLETAPDLITDVGYTPAPPATTTRAWPHWDSRCPTDGRGRAGHGAAALEGRLPGVPHEREHQQRQPQWHERDAGDDARPPEAPGDAWLPDRRQGEADDGCEKEEELAFWPDHGCLRGDGPPPSCRRFFPRTGAVTRRRAAASAAGYPRLGDALVAAVGRTGGHRRRVRAPRPGRRPVPGQRAGGPPSLDGPAVGPLDRLRGLRHLVAPPARRGARRPCRRRRGLGRRRERRLRAVRVDGIGAPGARG